MALSRRKIHELLRASKFPNTVICYRAGISNSYLNALLYGGRDNPSADVLVALAKELGCRVGDFFDDDAEPADDTEPAGAR